MKCKHTCVDVLDLQTSLLFFMNHEAFVKGVVSGTTSAQTVFFFSFLWLQIYQEDMMRSLLQNSLHVFRAISGTSTELG